MPNPESKKRPSIHENTIPKTVSSVITIKPRVTNTFGAIALLIGFAFAGIFIFLQQNTGSASIIVNF